MKVLIGQFTTESNANVPIKNDITCYDIAFGDELIRKMQVRDVFEEEKIEMIPSIYAVAGASGVIKKNTFEYIESCFVEAVKAHLHEIDGIYLMLHGASEVDEIGSGDHHILKTIRNIVGPYLPIAVACDPHGNLCKEYVESTTIIRSYRESPHIDQVDTWKRVARMLCGIIKERKKVHAIYRKLPLILGGEQSVSTDEPVLSINQFMDEMEKDPRILSVSWHVGYIRHDCPEAGCGIVVVPASEEDQAYCEAKADELAKYVWEKRHEFHYTGLTAQPEEALKMVLEFDGKPCVITDSGDNTTSGASGWNTTILRQVLVEKNLKKSFLFATICDPIACDQLNLCHVGEQTHISLGMNEDENSKSVELDVEIKSKGDIVRSASMNHPSMIKVFGKCVVVHVVGTLVDIIVASDRTSFYHAIQFEKAGVNWLDYDVTVVKQGYIFPELKENSKFNVMSLTQGATLQDTKNIPFKRIMRPMFPIDKI